MKRPLMPTPIAKTLRNFSICCSLCYTVSSFASADTPFSGTVSLYSGAGPSDRVSMSCKASGDTATCALVFVTVENVTDSIKTPAEHRAEVAATIEATYQDALSDVKKMCDATGNWSHEMRLALGHIPAIDKKLAGIRNDCEKDDQAKVAATFKQMYPSPRELLSDMVALEIQREKVRRETCSIQTIKRTVTMNRVSEHQWLWEKFRERPNPNNLGWRRLLVHDPEADTWTYREMSIRTHDAPATYIGHYLKYVSAKPEDRLHELGCKYVTQ